MSHAWLQVLLVFLSLLAFGVGGFIVGYRYRGARTAALGTVEPSPWRDYHSKEHEP
jgi:hypothetical protein